MGGKIFDKLLGFLKPKKKFKGKATKKKVLPKDPGAVLIAETLEKEQKESKKKGGLLGLFATGGLFARLLPILAIAIPTLLTIGTLLSDLFGEGGAISFFKKGDIGKGIATLLFGKDLSKKGKLGKILGITKQGAKWGAVGFLIGSIIPGVGSVVGGLIGFGLGAIGATIKLGIDSGFFKRVKGDIKKKTQELGGKKKLLKSVLIWSLLIPFVGPFVGLGMFYFGDKIKAFGGRVMNKLQPIIQNAFSTVGDYLGKKIIQPAKDLFNKVMDKISDFLGTQWDKLVDIGAITGEWIVTKIIEPVSDIFGKIKEKIIAYKDEKMLFIKELFGTVFESVREFFYKTMDFFSVLKLSMFHFEEWKDVGRIAGKRAELLGMAREQGIEKETMIEILKTDELRDAIREGEATNDELLTLIHEELKKLNQITEKKTGGVQINNIDSTNKEFDSEDTDIQIHLKNVGGFGGFN